MMPEKFNFIVVKEGDAAGKIFDNSGLLDGVSVKGDKIIYIKGNELWIRSLAFDINRFISRFYNSVSRAVFYSDDYNILFVSSGNLNFCDQIMQNCYVLRSFSNGDQFAVDGERIFFKEKSGKISVLNLAQN